MRSHIDSNTMPFFTPSLLFAQQEPNPTDIEHCKACKLQPNNNLNHELLQSQLQRSLGSLAWQLDRRWFEEDDQATPSQPNSPRQQGRAAEATGSCRMPNTSGCVWHRHRHRCFFYESKAGDFRQAQAHRQQAFSGTHWDPRRRCQGR